MAEKTQKTPRSKRRDQLKAESEEVRREAISFTQTVNRINSVEDDLQHDTHAEVENAIIKDTQKAQMLMNSLWRKMDKLLPNLKHVDGTQSGKIEVEINHRYV